MNESLVTLQKAVFETLNDDTILSAMINGVYDFVPEDSAYPYIAIRHDSIKDWSTVSGIGYEIEMAVTVYSDNRGSKQALEIADRAHVLLHDTNLTLDGGHVLVDLRYKNGDVKRSKGGLLTIATNNFIAFVED